MFWLFIIFCLFVYGAYRLVKWGIDKLSDPTLKMTDLEAHDYYLGELKKYCEKMGVDDFLVFGEDLLSATGEYFYYLVKEDKIEVVILKNGEEVSKRPMLLNKELYDRFIERCVMRKVWNEL